MPQMDLYGGANRESRFGGLLRPIGSEHRSDWHTRTQAERNTLSE